MAADHQKKRLNGAATIGCSSGEQHDAKMKHYGSPKHGLKLSSHISLEWDDNRSLVVSKKEQIGLRWRDLTPFIDSDPQWDDVLADVCAIPPEILELENLEEVLSFEIWKTHLSEEERNILMQFLPRELEAQNVVQALLGGDNVNFGNPFLKWGTSLCSGNIHPDIVLHQERCVKDKKRAYYVELRKYHNGIKEKLQKWKERWASCRSSEKEIVQNLWRSWPMNKKVSSHTKGSQSCDLEENLPGTSESCSWGANEKTCSSDYQNSLIKKGAKPRKRKCFMKGKRGKLMVAPDGIKLLAMPRKGEKLHGPNIQCSDAAKYMSYFKISKKQYQLVKSMNHSGNSIQPRSLTRVLGNLDHFHIQPYEIFEEEEQKKLHEYWLQLANVDLPVAFVDWKKRQLCRQQMFKSLEQELNIKLETLKEAEDKNTCYILKGLKNFRAEDHENTNEDDDEPVHLSAQNEALLQSPLNDGHILDAMELDAEDNNLVFQHDDAPLDVYSRNLNSSDIAGNRRASLSSCEDVWPEVSDPCSYSKEHASASEMPLGHSRVIEEQQAQLIDLKSGITEEMEKDLPHRHYNDEPLNTYFNQVGDELLQSLFKGQDSMFHQQQQSHAGLDLQAMANMLMETDRYGEQLQSPQSLGQLQNHQKELYIHQNIPNMLYDETKSFIPRQFHSPPVNLQDWVVNPIHMSAPPPSQWNNGDFFNLNMFSGEHQVHGDMSCSDGSSAIYRHGLGNGNGAQGSPFSMLPYSVLGAAKGNCGIIAGGSMLKNNNGLQQAANPLDYFSGNMGWMSLPHQNTTVHNSMGKQFLQSWNQ